MLKRIISKLFRANVPLQNGIPRESQRAQVPISFKLVPIFVPFQAGATSMWASCCGLLNEVMGTGAVRGQQSGFAGGTGPFRFTPNSDFSTYPPAPTEGPNIVCKACGLSFSVFRKKVSWMKCYIQKNTCIRILDCVLF